MLRWSVVCTDMACSRGWILVDRPFLFVQLSEEVKKVLKDYRKKKPDTITFEIYTTFQQLVELSANAQKE